MAAIYNKKPKSGRWKRMCKGTIRRKRFGTVGEYAGRIMAMVPDHPLEA
jgi:hypothetical protein